jgi:uroporphyrinogen III methyltransferase/synthase
MPLPNQARTGRVSLVGAGPGDPALITLRGVECLASADLVVYDYLANAQLLEHAPPSARRVSLGRHGHGRIMPQEEIHQLLIREALAGNHVVRLKSGDPMIFARASEEIDALRAAGIPLEIVPGITAALASGSYAGIPLTHRDAASAVALVTGRQQDNGSHEPLDYEALARFPGTLVFYMGVTTASQWSEGLIAAGMSADTPAAIVRRCSWSDQAAVRCTLGDVAQQLKTLGLRPPCIVIVGTVATLEAPCDWFTERPLFGKTVLVTRPRHQVHQVRQRLQQLGARVLVQPAVEISPPEDEGPLRAMLEQLERFDWIVFSSANGVRYFLDRLKQEGRDLRSLGNARIASIGPRTAQELATRGLISDLEPETFRAEALAEALSNQVAGQKVLLVRASRGREILARRLTQSGAEVTQVVAYQSRDVSQAEPEVTEALKDGEVDFVTVSSSAIARALVALLGESLRETSLVSISPITTQTLAELEFAPAAEASEYTMDGIVDAILQVASQRDC